MEAIAEIFASIAASELLDNWNMDDWWVANVASLFKKGSKDIPGNYRPVSMNASSG